MVFFVVPGVASNLCVARSIGSKMMLNKLGDFRIDCIDTVAVKDVQERFS